MDIHLIRKKMQPISIIVQQCIYDVYNLNFFSPKFYMKKGSPLRYVHVQLCQNKNPPETYPQKYIPRFTPRKTAATRPLPIERALKTDILTVSAACQQYIISSIPIHKVRKGTNFFFAELKFVVVHSIKYAR